MSDDPANAAATASDAVNAYMAAFYEATAQIEMAKRRILHAKDALADDLAQTLGALSETDRASIFSTAYWGAMDLPVEPLVRGFGFRSIQQIPGLARGATGVPCLRCGGEIMAASRTHLRKIQADAETMWPGWNPDRFCTDCVGRERAAHERSWSQESPAQQAWRERKVELRHMRYADYLRSPEWQQTRLAALKRAKYYCQLCATNQMTLDVHHNTYDRRGAEIPSDLIVLCRACHTKHHTELPDPPA